jgi:hypothetical protein
VLGNNGIAAPELVTFAEFLVAFAAVTPTPRNTVCALGFCTRYWFAAEVVETPCTGVGAVAAAINVTVFPIGVKAMMPIIFPQLNF